MKHLYELVQSMNNQEAAAFRQRHCIRSFPNYLKLFDIIINWQHRGIDTVETKIRQSGLTNITYLKHILLQKLCESFLSWKKNNTDEQSSLLHELIIIKSLRRRKLIRLANKKWETLFKFCLSKGHASFIQLLINEKWKLNNTDPHATSIDNYFHLVELSKNHADCYGQLAIMRNMEISANGLVKKSYLPEENDTREIFKLEQYLQHCSENNVLYNEEYQILLNTARSKIQLLKKDYTGALKIAELVFERLIRSDVHYFRNNKRQTLEFIKYYADLLFTNRNPANIPALFALIEAAQSNAPDYEVHREILLFLLKNRYYNVIRRYDLVDELYITSKDMVDHWINCCFVEWKAILLAGIAIAAYATGRVQSALSYISKYEKTYAKSLRKDSLLFFYAFSVLLAYELKDYQLFHSVYQRAYMHFYRNSDFKQIFIDILKPIKSAFNAIEDDTRMEVFKNILEKIAYKKDDKYYKLFFAYFDFPSWFQSKVARTSYAEYKMAH